MYPYIGLTPEDQEAMLEVVGLDKIKDLFTDVPQDLAFKGDLDMPKAMSPLEVTRRFEALAKKNITAADYPCFLGAGVYDHYVPATVAHIAGRSEFYTSYTPYQPEVSQGTLQYIFEYQTLMARLTGMPIANASLYDGPTAVNEACIMAARVTRRNKILMSAGVHYAAREIVKTYAKGLDLEIVEIPLANGVTDLAALQAAMDNQVAGVCLQSPNFLGYIEDLEKATEIAHSVKKTLMIASVDPISLAILKKPGDMGVDVVVGEGQALGSGLNYGGPYLGFFATTKAQMRKMPGRIVGETVDADGNRAYVLTLSAREQHIRREKATSNICSNQGLNALMAAVYMVTMGPQGLKEVATQSAQKAHYAHDALVATGKFKPYATAPFFKEFAVVGQEDPKALQKALLDQGVLGGLPLTGFYEDAAKATLIAVTEKRTKDEIDQLVGLMGGGQ